MNGQQACEFCFKHIDGLIKEWRETSVGIYLDKENRALGYEVISEGTADACLFDTKQLIRSACLVGANFVIVAHNHPSGNCRPSKLDIEQAEKIRRGLHAAGLILLDFVILTESGEGYTMCDERVIKCEKTPEKTEKESKCANGWKPSDRQLAALLTAFGDEKKAGSDVATELIELY
ncbi:JAB domain-containing protein, partial [Selenomonas ruminantium]|uniref:JAB domain-containing protein n=1 Tax=Selenomonas ruminantium TaxID=971 RepID=UPI0026EC833B